MDPTHPVVINYASEAKENMLLKGYIEAVVNKGVVIKFANDLKVTVPPAEAVDGEDTSFHTLKRVFPIGNLCYARVTSVSDEAFSVALKHEKVRLKVERPERKPKVNNNKRLTIDDLEVDGEVTGTVTAVNQLGVFVAIHRCKVPALSHPDQAKEDADAALDTLYSVGDRVKAKIIKVDKEKKRITLGLKASYFAANDDDMEVDEDEKDNENSDDEKEEQEEEEPPKPAEKGKKTQQQAKPKEGPTKMQVDQPAVAPKQKKEITGDAELELEQKKREKAAAETLSISSTFEWDGIVFKDAKGTKDLEESDEEEDEDEDGEEGEGSSKKKSKKLKAREREEQEKQVAKIEEDLLDPHRMPQTAADYERLLLASPNSSFLWIKFMAFQLGMTEIEKARAVAERALESESLLFFSFSLDSCLGVVLL